MIGTAGKAIFTQTDVSSPQDMEALVASAVARFDRLDMCVGPRDSQRMPL
jgi:NAD(P)-dependent dehydrogenase (short-subunit alcohol dehydrogenase family)